MSTLIGHTMNIKQEETRDTYAKFDMKVLDKISSKNILVKNLELK